MSKFSLETLNQFVHPYIHCPDPDVILGPVFGEDVALTKIQDGILVSHLDPIIGAVKNIGWLAVHVACNDIATSGAPPRWILPLVIVPHKTDEELLGEIMQDVGRAAKETGVSIIGGHSGYSASLARPLVAVTALGTLYNQTPVRTQGAQVGDHVFVSKSIALEGTSILAYDFSITAKNNGLSEQDLEEARALSKEISIIPEAVLLGQVGASAMHDVTRGGLLETLLEISELAGAGILIQSQKIPMYPVVERFASAFHFNPLQMISSGTLAATIPADKVSTATEALRSQNIPFADIGEIIPGRGVIMQGEQDEIHFEKLQPDADELARMWEIYPQDSAIR